MGVWTSSKRQVLLAVGILAAVVALYQVLWADADSSRSGWFPLSLSWPQMQPSSAIRSAASGGGRMREPPIIIAESPKSTKLSSGDELHAGDAQAPPVVGNNSSAAASAAAAAAAASGGNASELAPAPASSSSSEKNKTVGAAPGQEQKELPAAKNATVVGESVIGTKEEEVGIVASANATAAKTALLNVTKEEKSLPTDDTFSYSQAVKKTQREVPEWRVKVEQALREAKQAIQSASSKTMELDPQLTKSVYFDAYKFQKSYELMEKLFRVYMYKEGEPPLVHRGPLTGIYSSEGRFIHEMNQNTHFVTHDPQEAQMFFLPYSVAHMVMDLYVPGSHSMLPLATFIKDYVNGVAAKHPFWNMTHGADHFFVSCHDWGPATARDHPELRKNAVKVVCNADLTEEYVLDKDASLPETYLHTVKLPTRLGGPGPAKRPFLAFFAGQMHGRVRPALLQLWKDKDPDMKIYEVLPKEIAKKMSYEQHMRSSKFCICAMGFEVNSPRIVESIYYDCVPVLIADNFVLPLSDVINWDSFSLTIAEKDIPRLKEILLAVPPEQYRKMQSRLKRVRQHLLWHDSAQKYDTFHMILHSVWMRRLQQLDNIVNQELSI